MEHSFYIYYKSMETAPHINFFYFILFIFFGIGNTSLLNSTSVYPGVIRIVTYIYFNPNSSQGGYGLEETAVCVMGIFQTSVQTK